MGKHLLIYLFIGWILPPLSTYAQSPHLTFDHITVSDGLPVNTIHTISQDKNGFMWFGTKNGLSRFDGFSFQNFRNDVEDSLSLSNNNVQAIYPDSKGNLWVGTYMGLNLFQREKETFIRFFHSQKTPKSLTANSIQTIFEDSKGSIWIGCSNGLNLFIPETQSFKRFLPGSIDQEGVQDIIEDKKGRLLIATSAGFYEFDRKKYAFRRIFLSENKEVESISRLHEDKAGTLWVGTGIGLYRENEDGDFSFFQPFPNESEIAAKNAVSDIIEGEDGQIWVGTHYGLSIFDNEGEKFYHYSQDLNNPYSINDDAIFSLFKDQKNDIWVGTYFGGLNVFHKEKNAFVHYLPNGSPTSISGKAISSMVENPDGDIWIGTEDGGLNYFDRETNEFITYKAAKNGLSSNNIQTLWQEENGNLWIGTYGGGLNYFQKSTKKFISYQEDPNNTWSLRNQNVISILKDKTGKLWVGTDEGGLYWFETNTQKFILVPATPDGKQGPGSNVIVYMLEAENGGIWLANFNAGLDYYDPKTGTFTHYLFDPTDSTSIRSNQVTSIYEAQNGFLWIGTQGGGLNQFNQETEEFSSFQMSDGLPDNTIHGILEDEEYRLWLSTNYGLSRLDLKDTSFTNYTASGGLQSNQFSNRAFLKTRHKELVFGGINGFNLFQPKRVTKNTFVPSTVITGFRLDNELIPFSPENSSLTKPIGQTEEIVLKYTQNVFGFEFVSLDYTLPLANQYQFRLLGFQDNWNKVGNQRTATFTNLDAGDYVFQVRGSNSEEVWNTVPASIKIKILPPFWKTWWAYSFYLLLTVILLWIIRTYAIKRIRLENDLQLERVKREKIEELDQVKQKFFTNVSHELRTPLTMIIGPLDRLSEGGFTRENLTSQLGMVKKNAGKLLRMINQLLDFTKANSGNMTLRAYKGNLVEAIDQIASPFLPFAKQRNIQFQINLSSRPLQLWFDHEMLDKIIYNLLSNAFKFTPKGGSVTLSVNEDASSDHVAEIVVSDSGIGIPESQTSHIFERFYQVESPQFHQQKGTGIGLALTRELVLLHQGSIDVFSKAGEGSRFVVKLPMQFIESIHQKINTEEGLKKETDHSFDEMDLPNVENEDAVLSQLNLLNGSFKPTVLVIEDNPEVRLLIVQSLQDNYQMLEAENGKEGLEVLSKNIPDIIISDIMMPVMDGITFSKKVKEELAFRHIPLILLTAKAAIEDQLEGLETGADDYISKPFHPKLLDARVKNLIESRKKLKNLFSENVFIDPAKITTNSGDEKFLKKAIEIINQRMGESDFKIGNLADEMNISHSVCYRKIKALTGFSAKEFVSTLKMKKAAILLQQNNLSISEVAYEVGFNDPKYFSTTFRKQFGKSPTKYIGGYVKDLSGFGKPDRSVD